MDNKNNQQYLKQYKKLYKELQIECNNLKKALDTIDPLLIDFDSQIRQINNLKHELNNLHLYCLNEI